MATFQDNLATGLEGESVFMKELTRYSPAGNWINNGGRDTDFRSVTEGVIELKTETSQSLKECFQYNGQWLPRYQWFCVNYAHPKKNPEYPNKEPALRRGPWKTLRDGRYWAEKCNRPLKSLYIKQWIEQKLATPSGTTKLDRLLVIFDPEALARVLTRSIANTLKMFAHNYEVHYKNKVGNEVQIPARYGVKDLLHGKYCPDHIRRNAIEGTMMCRVIMDMQVVFKLLEEVGKPVTFDLEEGLRWLRAA